MKRNLTILFSLIALILFVTPLLAQDTAGCPQAKGSANCAGHKVAKTGCCDQGAGAMKGAAMKVTNLDNGVTVTMTGDNPETVKAIQAHAAQCAQHACAGNAHGKAAGCDPDTCPMKEATVKVTNTDDGAVITITSDKPETVAAIQKCMAECHSASGAKVMAHGDKAKAADACGKCPSKADCAKKSSPEKEIK
jgi:TusA-related sulfurtransferase